jgi:CheY-like chemotaxis protein
MPELDGYETARQIRLRETERHAPRVPIIAMTAGATDEIRSRCLDAGMDAYLTKPLGDDELDAALKHGLSRATAAPPGGLDRSRLARLRELFSDDEQPGAVLLRIGDEVSNALERARERAAAGDGPGVAREAHTIRGSAEMIGAGRLVEASAELERSASAAGVDRLVTAWEQTRQQLEAEVAEDQAAATGVSSPHVID